MKTWRWLFLSKSLLLLSLLGLQSYAWEAQAAVAQIHLIIQNNNTCPKVIRLYFRRAVACNYQAAFGWHESQNWLLQPGDIRIYDFVSADEDWNCGISYRIQMDGSPNIDIMPETQSTAERFTAVLGTTGCSDVFDSSTGQDDPSDNGNDCNDPSGCADCSGMPVWGISEPYIALWLRDEPLGYQPAQGPRISLKLAYKQKDLATGMNPNVFGTGKKWNFSWLSFVTQGGSSKTIHFPDGRERAFSGTNDYLTNTRLTGDSTNGFTLAHPDGRQEVYGFVVTNSTGTFLKAFLTESANSQGQKARFNYDNYTPGASPVIRLNSVVDGDGRTNSIYYVTSNGYSTNLVSHVVDAFGRTNFLAYDNSGQLTSLTDVAGLSSSVSYGTGGVVASLTTPYGITSFAIGTTTNSRSVLVTQPDGGKELYLYQSSTPGLAGSYPANQLPDLAPFSHTLDNANLEQRNSFHWGVRQYAALSTTNVSDFTTNDFFKARLKHWLAGTRPVGNTVAMLREPSSDTAGTMEGQKTWYDYEGKTNSAYEGTQVLPLFVAQVLPDGTTRSTRTERNSLGAVTNEISTYSVAAGGPVLLRTNRYTYAADGIDLLTITNALGVQVSSNSYNGFHLVTTNFNALGEVTVTIYDASNRVSSVILPTGLVTTNIYGADGFVAQSIVTGIATNSATYSNDLVFTATDARGLTTTNTYDALQRLTRVDYPDGTFITNTYDKLDLVRTVDRMGFPATFGYDALRRNTAVTNALGFYTLKDYCSCGALNSVRDAAGNYTWFFYDNAGRETNAVFADGYSVTNTFNLIGQTIRSTDSAGTSVTNWFNNQGMVVAVSNAFGRVSAATFDALSRATNVIDANGVTITSVFDNASRLLTRGYPDGGVEKFGYTANFAGATSYTNQLNLVTRYVFDAASRLITVTNANNEVVQTTYSGAGDKLTLTDGKNQTTTWHYDEYGRTTNKVDAASNEIFRFAYDPNNRLTNLWTPAKGSITYRFDSVGNVTNVIYPVSSNVVMQYDSLNRMTNRTDAVGTTKYSYTVASLLASEDGPWSNNTISYAYQNRLRSSMSLSQPSGTWTNGYGYDVAKRLTSLTSPAGNFTYTYQPTRPALLDKLTLPGGAYITNSYDVMTHLLNTSLKTSGGVVRNSHAYEYNLASQRTKQSRTDGSYVDYTYDGISQLKTAFGKESGGTTNRLNEQMSYSYDAAGNLNYRTNNALVQTFNVDSLNQLSTINRSGTLTVAGNTTTAATNVTVNGLTALRYGDLTYARTNFPLVDATTNFTAIAQSAIGLSATNTVTVDLRATNACVYDLNGNLRTNGNQVFEYDDENRLVTNYVMSAWKSEFVYDGANKRRIQRDYSWSGSAWVKTNETHLVYDGNVIIQHRDGNNVPTLTLTRGLDLSGSLQGAGGIGGLLAMTEASGTSSYYHGDGSGNVTTLINANQLIVGKYSYDSFGRTLSISGPKAPLSPYRFSSKPQHEPSGKYDYLYRWYDPALQRFANVDPNQEADGHNRFTFVHNDSINAIDDFGLGTIYIENADGSTYLEITPTQARQLTRAEKIRDLVLPNPKETIRQADQAFATAANPDRPGYERVSAGIAGTSIVILGVVEFVPGAGAETKPLKRECVETVLKALPQHAKSSVDDVIAKALKRGLNLGEHAGERLLGREGEVTMKMIETTLQKGNKFYDPVNKSYVSVLEKGMASGKDIAVAVDAVSGEIRTIMTNTKIVRPRFQPVP